MATPDADHAKAPEPKPGSTPEAKDDLKTLPLPEVEKRLGSSPDGLTQAEATKRLAQYGPNEIEEKKTNALLKFLSLFLGSDPLDDRSRGRAVGRCPPLARLLHHSCCCSSPTPPSASGKSARPATPSKP